MKAERELLILVSGAIYPRFYHLDLFSSSERSDMACLLHSREGIEVIRGGALTCCCDGGGDGGDADTGAGGTANHSRNWASV